MARKVGRPDKWASGLDEELVAAIEAVKIKGKGVRDAIALIKRVYPEKWPQPARQLATRYYEHLRRRATLRRVAD